MIFLNRNVFSLHVRQFFKNTTLEVERFILYFSSYFIVSFIKIDFNSINHIVVSNVVIERRDKN